MLRGVATGFGAAVRNLLRPRTAVLDRQAAQLRESEERLRDFAEASSDWFWEMNEDLVMTYMSPNFTTVTGIDVDLVLGKDCDQFISAVCGKVSIEEHKRHLRERLPYREFQFEIAMPGHASVFVSTSGRPAFDAAGRFLGFRGTGNDITEKRRLEQAVAVAEARAHQAQKMEAIGQMTGGIAHDFNNLLQVILGNADVLETENPPGSEGHLAAQQIRLAGERAARLTSHLLAFARQQPLEPAPMNLGEVADSLRPLLQRVLGESIALHCRLPAVPILAVADRAQVESALVNLALNARDAMPDGGTFAIAVDAGAFGVAAGAEAMPAACARLRVSDTGTGMSAEVKERAFEPFFTTKEVGKGTGLGLSMVFGFAEQSGGYAELESAPGRGTTITIMLPLAKAEVTDESLPAAPEVPSAAGPATILVVEDDSLVRAQVAMSIRTLGYEVIEVADGASALKEIETRRRIDLLFTDIVMPGGVNGRELAAKASAMRPGLRVLFTSGYTDNVFIRDGRREAGPRLLAKPYRWPDLARVLREVLEEDRPAANGAAKPVASTA